MAKERVDVLLVSRGLAESRTQAQRLVMAGLVRVNGQVVDKPADKAAMDAEITVEALPKYVSRGGEKLEAALESFGLTDLSGWVCADVGASTGGFTDCLLQHGAEQVFALDVGYGVLHWKLRNDRRVVVMEKTNARKVERLPEDVKLVTIDASFISLKILLPVVKGWFGQEGGRVVALIKPQFEAGRKEAAHGDGVIRDPAVHLKVLRDVLAFAQGEGFGVSGVISSPLLGPKGNREFLAHLIIPQGDEAAEISLEGLFPETANPK
jgi:23S rRNA (cytidine1920-2'-O)/16S rRNA (cytidine1409-2'-O)-methyltransferase